MKLISKKLLAMLSLAASATSYAADFTFSGNIEYHNDVVRIDFTLLSDAVDVSVWTDSFMIGQNFDPITAVWRLPSGLLVGQNDDNASIFAGQSYYDSGLKFASLSAGSYAFTVTPFRNFAPANLFDPFGYSGDTPIPIADWCQPASNACLNQKGTFWRVHLSGVDSAAPIPEPSTTALLMAGLMVIGAVARRRSQYKDVQPLRLG
ncbi:DVUA0089 family protein [uncultured Sphaerotilus sp.]|uniref:DVUA0089 family protein n=1 Tax=uncultured Sphaerotilus sp. TaxID=474984 RepID=UPI0030CA497E